MKRITNIIFRSFILWGVVFWTCANNTSTDELLSGAVIPDEAYSYAIASPAFVQVGQTFTIAVNAKVYENDAIDYTGSSNIALLGAGNITVPENITFSGGSANVDIVYSNSSLTAGSTVAIYLSVTDTVNSSMTETSSLITAGLPAFTVTAPPVIELNVPFMITIDATLSGAAYVGYFNSVGVTVSGNGTLVLNGPVVFSSGSAQVSVTYVNNTLTGSATEAIFVNVQDELSPALIGSSPAIMAGKTVLAMNVPLLIEVGVPFSVTLDASFFGNPNTGYTHTVNLTVVGEGSLNVTSQGVFSAGTAFYTAIYTNDNMTAGDSATVFIQASDSIDSTITSTSPAVTVGKQGFFISTPTGIDTGQPFDITITAILFGVPNTSWTGTVNLSENGPGFLTVLNAGSFSSGVAVYTIRYDNPNLERGSTEQFQITATDNADAGNSGTSISITASVPVSLDHFEISLPLTIYQNEPFSVTITAIGSDAEIFMPYNGTVNISTTTADGSSGNLMKIENSVTMGLSSAFGFVNGVLTIPDVTYDAIASGLYIHAIDSADNTKTGRSRAVTVFGSTLSVYGTPVDTNSDGAMDAARLVFSVPIGTFYYKVWRGSTLLGTVFVSAATYFLETGITESLTSYDYEVEAYSSTNTLLKSASVSVILKPCTTISAGMGDAITARTTWTLAEAPYCINSNVTVSGAGTVLTIEPGVSVLFADNVSMVVNSGASVSAIGTGMAPVSFTSANANPAPGSWNGIKLESTALANNISVTKNGDEITSETPGNQGSVFKYSAFSYAKHGIITNVPVWVEYSQFMKNYAHYLTAGADTAHGTGMRILGSNYTVVRNSMFIQNEGSDYGNNPADIDIRNTNAGAVIRNNVFFNSRCSSQNSGGGSVGIGSTAIASTIYGNTFYKTGGSGSGGAIYITSAKNNIIRKNIFQETYSAVSGGAIYIYNGVSGHKIRENTFIGTHGAGTGSGSEGGAIYLSGSGGDLIQDNTFVDTYTSNTYYGTTGGAISISGGSGTIIYNNYFKNTRAVGSSNSIKGGAIQIFGVSNGPTIMNNTFEGTYVSKNTITAGLAAYGGQFIWKATMPAAWD
jgi:hypothetical protein